MKREQKTTDINLCYWLSNIVGVTKQIRIKKHRDRNTINDIPIYRKLVGSRPEKILADAHVDVPG